MSVLLPHFHDKHRRERSKSLPPTINGLASRKAEEKPGNAAPKISKAYAQSHVNDDWSHLEPDEQGAELAREARVWKVYVGETDKWDKEVIEGWEKSMDVLLVFAGLFSAVVSAFLIESSSMLKEDPNDVSAAALVAISQALVTIATSNSSAASLLEPISTTNFIPPQNAVTVNILWYISLSLSIATAFLAMLAKDWCYSFWSRRTGHPRDQAYRRQRKWKMIERWKMQELIIVLPLLMHLSLLLFSVGLWVYLWDLNTSTSIPVMCIAGAFFLFYIWSSITASIVESFPYTTIISRILRSTYMQGIYSALATLGSFISFLVSKLYLIFGICYCFVVVCLALIIGGLCSLFLFLDQHCLQLSIKKDAKIGERVVYYLLNPMSYVILGGDVFYLWSSYIYSQLDLIVRYFELTEELITSLALSWIIQNCETPSAVDIALQAISGASTRVPKDPLLTGQATTHIMRRIVSCDDSDANKLKNNLYIRSLEFLGSGFGSHGDQEETGIEADIQVIVWELKSKNEWKISNLIKDGSFVPSADNLKAIRLGNSAASGGLDLLLRRTYSTARSLNMSIQLLSQHVDSEKKLHPAALQSLAFSIVIHTSWIPTAKLPPSLADLCVKYCSQLVGEYPNGQSSAMQSSNSFEVGASLVTSVISHSRLGRGKSLDLGRSSVRPHSIHVARSLMDIYVGKEGFRRNIFWVGCLELVCHPRNYGLDDTSDDYKSLKEWCSRYTSIMIDSMTKNVMFSSHRNSARDACDTFLWSVRWIYDLVLKSDAQNHPPLYIPEPLYALVIALNTYTLLEASHATICQDLISRSSFPRPSTAFAQSLQIHVGTLTVLSLMGHSYMSEMEPSRSRRISATQLWLVVHMMGQLDPEDQERVKEGITPFLRNRGKDVHQFKEELEDYIIQSYQKDHSTGYDYHFHTATRYLTSIWNKIKSSAWSKGHNPQPVNTHEEELDPEEKRDRTGSTRPRPTSLTVYTARIVECILEARGIRDKDLEEMLEQDLRDLPSSLRGIASMGLSRHDPTIIPLVSAQTENEPSSSKVLESPTEYPLDSTEYVALDIHRSPS